MTRALFALESLVRKLTVGARTSVDFYNYAQLVVKMTFCCLFVASIMAKITSHMQKITRIACEVCYGIAH